MQKVCYWIAHGDRSKSYMLVLYFRLETAQLIFLENQHHNTEIGRKMKKTVAIIATMCGLSLPVVAFAGVGFPSTDSPILKVNNSVSIGFNDINSNYSETLPSPADVENGRTPGFHVGASVDTSLFGINGVYANFGYDYASGKVTYAEGNFSEKAGHTENDLHLRLGKTIFFSNSTAITPYIMGGYRWWYRAVPHGVADPENYSNAYVGAGAMFQYAINNDLTLSLRGGIGEVVYASVSGKTNSYYVALYNSPAEQKFSLSDRPYYTAGLKATYINSKNLGIYADVDYRDFMYGASGFNQAGFEEPSSQTSQFSFGAGVMYSF